MSKSTRKTTSSRSTKSSKTAAVKLSVVGAEAPESAAPVEAAAPVAAPEMPEAQASEAELEVLATDTVPEISVQVKKKDFVERVAIRSGAKKPVVRDLTEVVLAVMAEALAAGETLVVPPLGKLIVARGGKTGAGRPGGEVLHLKLKRMAAADGAKKGEDSAPDPLAEAED